jgi:pyruvate dehydrogenase E2 component (dihydrolipoamide acetyltransferase)
MGDFCMPSLGADMEAGTLVEWHVAPGAHVKRGDVVALVETQKGLVEIEIWESGVVTELLVGPGTQVPVGTVLAKIASGAASRLPIPEKPIPEKPIPEKPMPEKPMPEKPKTNGASATVTTVEREAGRRPRASPAARQLARERNVDLAALHGTGPHEAITRADVERASSMPTATPAPTPTPAKAPTPPATSGMRKAIAAAMARSKREIPHYYLGAEIDVSRAIAWLEAENARRAVTARILFAALLLKATALALREVPELNGVYVDGEHRPSNAIHVGVAIALKQGGLVAPAIHDTDQRTLDEIMNALSDLVGRVRSGSLRSSEMTDPTITVTNLGDQGTDSVFGVIYPPQVALVGYGRVRERPWAEGGMVGARPVVVASLAADHRVSDGHRGARFLGAVARLLSTPEAL